MPNPHRTLSNEEFLEDYNSGLNDCEIAKKRGLSHVSVAYRRYRLKLKANAPSRSGHTLETKEELEVAYQRILDCIRKRKHKKSLEVKAQ